jgi:hypothetical protein
MHVRLSLSIYTSFFRLLLGCIRRFQLRARLGSSVERSPVPPHQTVRAVLPHTAFRSSSSQSMRVRRYWAWVGIAHSPNSLKSRDAGHCFIPLPLRCRRFCRYLRIRYSKKKRCRVNTGVLLCT